MKKQLTFLAILAVLWAAGTPNAHGQTGTGVVRGSVLDESSAAVAGAKLTLTNRDTNIGHRNDSSAGGLYQFVGIQPGRYSLLVEHQGFKKWSTNLVLEVGQITAIEAKLQVGSVETTVTVEGNSAPVITTESSEIADVKDSLRIRQLPLNRRDVRELFNLTPGVEGGGVPRVNGLKVGSVEMLLDGQSLVDRFGGGLRAGVSPGLDTIQEFRIETSGSSAQYSRPATVTLVTKSGTNQLHGALFETIRNNGGGLRARTRQDGAKPAFLARNEFGGSAGGPVRLGKVYNGRDKSFWFFAYEGMRLRQKTFYQTVVPTAEMWQGNFNKIIDNQGRQSNIFDPLTTGAQGIRSPFAGNIVPRARIHPVLGVMESVTHAPTSDINPYQGNNMREFYPLRTNDTSLTIKGDHRFSDSDNISARFTSSRREFSQLGGRFGGPKIDVPDAYGTSRVDARIYNSTIRHTHLFTPTLINEFMVASNRAPKSSGTLADFTDWPQKLGFPNPFGARGWPSTYTEQFDWDADNRKDEMLTAHNLENNTTWVKGRHTVKFGGKVRFEYNNIRELQQAQGSHEFGPEWTSQYVPSDDEAAAFTGDGLASMALGLPGSLGNQYNRGYFYFEQREFGLYVQDTWKVSNRLTLDLGLRFDKWTAYKEKYNRMVNVDLSNIANRFEVVTPKNTRMEDLPGVPPSVLASWKARGLTWRTAREAGMPDNLVKGDNNNFGPRLGAAYKLSGKTVLRASYGEFFWTMPLSQILQASRTNPPLNLFFQNNISTLDGTDTFAVRTAPRPDFFIGKATVSTEGIVDLPLSARSITPWDANGWRDNRAQSWHFTLERELLKDTALRLSYIGNHGRDLDQKFALNSRESEFNYVARTGQNPPGNGDLRRVNRNWNFGSGATNHTGYSNTHSLQAELERRYSNGLAFQFSYAFTRSLTTSDAGGFESGGGNINSTNGVSQVPQNIQLLGGGSLNYDQLLRLGYQNSTTVPAQRVRYNGIYDLPFGKGKKFGNQTSRAADHLIGGWQIAALGDWRSGLWGGVSPGQYLFGDPTLSGERLELTFAGRRQRLWFRGNFNPLQATNVDQQTLQGLVPANQGQRILRQLGPSFNNRLPQTLANGTIRQTPIGDTVNGNSRAFYRGPGSWNTDFSAFKNFHLGEKVTLRFTADFFNVLNHPLDVEPNTTTGLQDLSTQPNEPRVIQFSLRLQW